MRHRIIASFTILCVLLSTITFGKADALDNFKRWCEDKQIKLDKIDIQQIEGYDRGVIAKADIKEGEIILTVPSSAVITAYTAIDVFSAPLLPPRDTNIGTFKQTESLDLEGVHLTEADFDQLSDAQLITLLFLYFKHNNIDSIWSPFINVFPTTVTSPAVWSEAESNELLQASPVIELSHHQRLMLKSNYLEVLDVIKEYPDIFPHQIYTFEEYLYASLVTLSRVFSVKVDEEPLSGLVPVADMFNTESSQNIKLKHRMADNVLQLIASQPISKGEQIFAPYGRKGLSNSDMMMIYGFALPNNENEGVVVPTPRPIEKDQLFEKKKHALVQLDIWAKYMTIAKARLIPDKYLMMSRVNQANEHELEQLLSSIPEDRDAQTLDDICRQQINVRNEKAAIEYIIDHLKQVLSQYKTTAEEDAALLEETKDLKQRSAIIIRRQEKLVIQALLNTFGKELARFFE